MAFKKMKPAKKLTQQDLNKILSDVSKDLDKMQLPRSEVEIAAERRTMKVGDVVVLKSGGPKMTVENRAGFMDTVTCRWSVAGQFQRATFYAAMLTPVKKAKKS